MFFGMKIVKMSSATDTNMMRTAKKSYGRQRYPWVAHLCFIPFLLSVSSKRRKLSLRCFFLRINELNKNHHLRILKMQTGWRSLSKKQKCELYKYAILILRNLNRMLFVIFFRIIGNFTKSKCTLHFVRLLN